MFRKPFPGYENHVMSGLKSASPFVKEALDAQHKSIVAYALPEGMKMEERLIPSSVEGEEMKVIVFTPAGLPEKAPMVLDIHGGAWVGGSAALDSARCIALASKIPAIVVSVEYHLSKPDRSVRFPTPLLDCYKAYMWMHDNAEALGGDAGRLGIHGSSSGGNLAGGLALYLRDQKGPKPRLAVLNCPCVDNNFLETASYFQNYENDPGKDFPDMFVEDIYVGGYSGGPINYYAFPAKAHDLRSLCPHMIVVAEFDPLRDSALEYGMRLLRTGVPCELLSSPRVGHTFTCVPHPYTDLVHDMMAMSFQREFGLLDSLGKPEIWDRFIADMQK